MPMQMTALGRAIGGADPLALDVDRGQRAFGQRRAQPLDPARRRRPVDVGGDVADPKGGAGLVADRR